MQDPAAGDLLALATRPVTIDAAASVAAAAQAMGEKHVGSVVVTEDERPVGLVTDRDLVMASLLRPKGSEPPPVGEVASRPFLHVMSGATVVDATNMMEHHCVRRIGVVDASGALVGVISADDVLLAMGRSLEGLAGAVAREFAEEIDPTSSTTSSYGPE
ncbi:MAG: CBS domain-containing protein [Planctomycetota bacterium]